MKNKIIKKRTKRRPPRVFFDPSNGMHYIIDKGRKRYIRTRKNQRDIQNIIINNNVGFRRRYTPKTVKKITPTVVYVILSALVWILHVEVLLSISPTTKHVQSYVPGFTLKIVLENGMISTPVVRVGTIFKVVLESITPVIDANIQQGLLFGGR